jgi:hypothetical protein
MLSILEKLEKLEKLETLKDSIAVSICVLSLSTFVLSILLIVVVNKIEKINTEKNLELVTRGQMLKSEDGGIYIGATEGKYNKATYEYINTSDDLNSEHNKAFINFCRSKGDRGCTINGTYVSFYNNK